MKTLIKATLTLAIISMCATSCTSKKQNCDAYGVISKAETTNTVVITNDQEMVIEKKS